MSLGDDGGIAALLVVSAGGGCRCSTELILVVWCRRRWLVVIGIRKRPTTCNWMLFIPLRTQMDDQGNISYICYQLLGINCKGPKIDVGVLFGCDSNRKPS